MSEHAFLAPSAAARWVKCALAPTLEALHPETEPSTSSLEGTAAHWVAEQRVRGHDVEVGAQAPNSVAVTLEMLEAAELVREEVRFVFDSDEIRMVRAESRVEIGPENWGTPDYFAWVGADLHVWDFKYGRQVVEAYENWQMINYVEGIFKEGKIDGLSDQKVTVNMTIIQPRAYHREGTVRTWSIRGSDLRGYFNTLANARGLALSADPKASPTPRGCTHCRGRHVCEGLQRAAYAAADLSEGGGALELKPLALGRELRALRHAQALLDARVSGLEAEAEAVLRAGGSVPFWSLESTPGRLAWSRPAQEVIALGQMVGVEITKPPEPLTPTQAKAAAKVAKIPPELFDAFTTRPPGAVKLTPDDGIKAKLIFERK